MGLIVFSSSCLESGFCYISTFSYLNHFNYLLIWILFLAYCSLTIHLTSKIGVCVYVCVVALVCAEIRSSIFSVVLHHILWFRVLTNPRVHWLAEIAAQEASGVILSPPCLVLGLQPCATMSSCLCECFYSKHFLIN